MIIILKMKKKVHLILPEMLILCITAYLFFLFPKVAAWWQNDAALVFEQCERSMRQACSVILPLMEGECHS